MHKSKKSVRAITVAANGKPKTDIQADAKTAAVNANLAVDLGLIRVDQKDSYIKGWMNRGFYR